MEKVSIIPFEEQYSKYFYQLNREWLEAFFYVEPYDEKVLSQPQKYIIDQGGYIFFAKINNQIVGTVALMKIIDTVYELSKMAVSPERRGQKIGHELLQHCINFSKENHIEKLLLYSNRKLENAIYLYKKYGFKEIPLELDNPYARGDIKMELIIDEFTS
ncbi:GNAT family N-acetyltransferase [Kordia zhangzhouensis]|uniref:GNAT family N-acetyltransferase n=1 Tax=Kordia zhangzhouensis TaxID=1620405 RepID=UPI000629BCC8|nr:GNAT family N-acetyltransferase [Kordia zhangzhouensis]